MSLILGRAIADNPDILRGTSADQARVTVPKVQYRWVPWRDWKNVTDTSNLIGTTDFYYTLGGAGTNKFQVANNTDSQLYLSSAVADRVNLLGAAEAIVGPFGTANITLASDHVSMIARVYGYDFTTPRAVTSPFDVRGPTAYISLTPLAPNEEPPLPVLRNAWSRIYDKFDFAKHGNGAPASFTTNQAWDSDPMDFGGAANIYLNANGTCSAVPNNGSTCGIFVNYFGIATGQGNWSAGGGSLSGNVGFVYVTNAAVTIAANKPQLEIFFTPGDTTGSVVTINDLWVTGIING
jgi:hypothetical protein